ncbi:MAG: tetratricopeptide repeat protein, partial [Proteobacteria bacterium]|nr:tetratricopeptide repeat protein [Pseudomonadota bacterium]
REEAKGYFLRALDLDPNYPLTHWNLALIDLACGDLARGWAGYARRFGSRQLQRGRRLTMPEWRGESLAGRRLLVWSEQGLGDEILFASCFPDLIRLGGHYVVECDHRLVTLFQRSFPQVEVRPESVDSRGRETLSDPGADLHIAAGGLPALLRTGFDRFPTQPGFLAGFLAGFLIPDPVLVARWRERLAALGPEPKIGICWRSQLMTANRIGSYTRLDQWQPVLTIPGVHFVNLQYDECSAELDAAERCFGVTIARWPDLDLTNNLEEAAALTVGLDLVITVATSVGEMAGALGVPVWRLNSERDWTTLGTTLRPWFPSMRTILFGEARDIGDALAEAGWLVKRGMESAKELAVKPVTVAKPAAAMPLKREVIESADPRLIESILLEATTHHRAGRVEQAETLYQKVLELDRNQPVALHLLGWLAYQVGQKDVAVQLIERAIAVEPTYVAALTNLGTVLHALERFEEAATLFRRALALRPNAADILTNLGNALGLLGRWDEAEDCHRRSLTICPDDPMVHANLGAALWRQGRFAQAETILHQALALDPDHAIALATLGTVLRSQARQAEAETCIRRALVLDDTLVEAWSDLARTLAEDGRCSEAETCFAKALALVPNCASARFNQGLMRLVGGDLKRGWEGHDWRFRDPELRLSAHPSPAPEWRGEPLGGQRLLVWREQGLGDELMFASCYPDLIRRAGHCILECDPRLASLFVRAFPGATVRAAGGIARPETDDHDYQIAAGSLPRLLRPNLPTFSHRGGFLAPEPARANGWRARLAALGPGAKVGICWRSRLNTPDRAGSYTRLDQWRPVLTLPG